MQGHGAVEVGLGGPHADGDRRHLDDLGGMLAHHVAAQYPATGLLHDQLEQHLGIAGGECLAHRPEAGAVHLDPIGTAPRDRLLFGEPHAGQFGLGKHGAGYQAVVHLTGLVAIHRVGEGAALIHRHRRQVDAVGHIANGVDAVHVGALIGIHRDAGALHGHPGGLQVQPLEEGFAAGGEQHAAAGNRFAALGGDAELAGGALAGDRCRGVRESDLDARGLHPGAHRLAGLAVEAAQEVIAAHQLGHLNAQAIEDACEFAGNEARAHHHHPLGEALEFKHVIAEPAQFGAGDLGALGPAAHGDQDPFGVEFALTPVGARHHHAGGAAEAAPAPHQLHAGFLQKTDVQAVQPVHLSAHVGEQAGRVEAHVVHIPAVAGGIGQQVAVGRAVHQQLFGHAAADHAGAAHPVALHDRHPGAVAGGPLGGGQAAGAGAQHDQIEAVAHGWRARGSGQQNGERAATADQLRRAASGGATWMQLVGDGAPRPPRR